MNRTRTSWTTRSAAALGVLAPVLVLGLQAPAEAAATRIVSDGSWKYSSARETGWTTRPFDDSAWANVVPGSEGLCGVTNVSYIPRSPAQTMWGADPAEFQVIYLRKTFTLPAATSGVARTRVDDDYDLYVNGQLVRRDNDAFASDPPQRDVVALKAGRNVVAIKAIDAVGGCQSVSFDLLIGGSSTS